MFASMLGNFLFVFIVFCKQEEVTYEKQGAQAHIHSNLSIVGT